MRGLDGALYIPLRGERGRGKRGCSPRSGSRKLNECGWFPGSVTHLSARSPGEVPPGAQGLPHGVAQGGEGASKVP